MKGLDTNVLVRYLTQDDPAQARKANALIDGAARRGERLHLDIVVLCELAWVLLSAYHVTRDTVAATLARLLEVRQFSIEDRDLLRQAVESYQEMGGDFADYAVGLRNQRAGCSTTVTFDRRLHRHALFSAL
jgi:predicted nucleic-acid-binding protein